MLCVFEDESVAAPVSGGFKELFECWATELTVFTEELPELLLIHVFAKVFDVDIGELLGSGAQLSLALFARLEATHKSAVEWTVRKTSEIPASYRYEARRVI